MFFHCMSPLRLEKMNRLRVWRQVHAVRERRIQKMSEREREKDREVYREGKKERLGINEVMSPQFPHLHMRCSLSLTVAQQREREKEGNRGIERRRDIVGEREKCGGRL